MGVVVVAVVVVFVVIVVVASNILVYPRDGSPQTIMYVLPH